MFVKDGGVRAMWTSTSSFNPKKHLGQHLLIDPDAIRTVINAVPPKPRRILEIGPGRGALTIPLVGNGYAVTAIEYDSDMVDFLKKQNITGLTLHQENILDTNLTTVLGTKQWQVLGALPYNITSPILHRLITHHTTTVPQLTSMVFILQREVGEKLCTSAPDASYWSHLIHLYGTAELIAPVPAASFNPPPKVESCVVRLIAHEHAPVPPETIPHYIRFIRHTYLQQRKMLNKRFDPALLTTAGIDPQRRAESLSSEELHTLFMVSKKRLEINTE